jgi:hypothetical protein
MLVLFKAKALREVDAERADDKEEDAPSSKKDKVSM